MLKRLSIVALFTGSSHLISLIALSVLAFQVDEKTIGSVGLVDSTIFIIMGILAFGLQLQTIRELTQKEEWQPAYTKGQSARFSMSLVLAFIGFILLFTNGTSEFLIFLAAPIIALNGDFSLYGLGRAEKASFLSFIRVLVPSVALLIASFFFQAYVMPLYALTSIITILFIGLMASSALKVGYLHKVNPNFLSIYWKSKDVGVLSLGFIIMTSGLIFFAKHFGYPEETLGLIYPIYKIYFILKGLQRIVNQSFLNEMYDTAIALKLDKLCILSAVLFSIPSLFFPDFSVTLLYGKGFAESNVNMILLGLIALVTTIRTTSDTRVFLNHGDRQNATYIALASLITLGGIGATAWWGAPVWGLLGALLIGEILLLLCYTYELGGFDYLVPRLLFLMKAALLPTPALLYKMFGFQEHLPGILITCGITAILTVVFFRKTLLIK